MVTVTTIIVGFIIVMFGILSASIVTSLEKNLTKVKEELENEKKYSNRLNHYIKVMDQENLQLRDEIRRIKKNVR
jgi:uncharacterized membrane-anchored protein YhcB (DUF1043 family)